jgi:hypothetical protein
MEPDSATAPLEAGIAAAGPTPTVEPGASQVDQSHVPAADRPPKGARALSSGGFCGPCQQQFRRRRSDQQYCSSACRAKASREARQAELSDWIEAVDRALDHLAKRHGIVRRPGPPVVIL